MMKAGRRISINDYVISFLTKSSSRQRDKFLDIRLTGREQGGQNLPALGGDLISVGLVFEAQSFRSKFEAVQDFALVVAMHPAIGLGFVPKKTQDFTQRKLLLGKLKSKPFKLQGFQGKGPVCHF
jgi:hypothetical protein